MDFTSVTQIAYLGATVLSLVLTVVFLYQFFRKRVPFVYCVAAAVQTGWLYHIAQKSTLAMQELNTILVAEALHYGAWILALTYSTEKYCSTRLPSFYKYFLYIACIGGVGFSIYCAQTAQPLDELSVIIMWQGVLFSILGLLSIEQLYRNTTTYRFIKLLCINLAVVFIFDAYLFSQNLVFSALDTDLWQTRAAVSMASSVLLILGLATLIGPTQVSAKINISRPVIFYTTSLTFAGLILTVLSFGGYYVRLYGGNWGTVIYTILLVSGLLLIGSVFTSRSLREKLSVLINKHLFSYKYDYRAEWLKLISELSKPSGNDPAAVTIKVAAEMFKCDGGALWLKKSKVLVPTRQINVQFDIADTFEPESSDFCQALTNEWIFSPKSNAGDLSHYNNTLPDWIKNIKDVWLITALLTETNLVGFLILTNKNQVASPNWEDLDLLKTVGRQLASYITRHEQAEQLTEARQFDAFNKLSAFVMHDLKNLIAQQSLVVKNAEKHKDNPAFVEDAINTINNSVVRMNNLLRKLQHNAPEEAKVLVIKDVLIEAVKRCQKTPPVPTLLPVDASLKIKADFDSIVMVFTHIIHNAQDATPNNGFIDITTTTEDKLMTICIEDNGAGMTEDFIRNKLFKPFETTKSGKGMGVGVYQAREYIQSLGGNINVESSPDEGSTFIITLPTI